MIYFDSCYLAKLYLSEPDSGRVRAVAQEHGEIGCCLIGHGEILATFHRHLRERRISGPEFRVLADQLAADVGSGLWTFLPVTPAVVEHQVQVLASLPADVSIRAADALHLACAAVAGLDEIHSSDRHLVAAATHFGLTPVTL